MTAIWKSVEFYPFDNNQALVQAVAWHQTYNNIVS